MGSNQTLRFSHSKGNEKQNEKITYGKNICKQWDQQGLNFQNTQTVHTIQQQQQKSPLKK